MTDEHPNQNNDPPRQQESKELQMAIDSIRKQELPEQSLQKTLRAAESIGMTKAAWKRGLLNMITVAVPMFILVEVGKRLLSGPSKYEQLMSVFWITTTIFVLCVVAGAIETCWSWRKSGRVLIDGGEHPGRVVFRINACMMTCFGIGTLWAGPTSMPPVMGYGMLAFAFFMMLMSCGRLQFCDAGIWQYWNLLPWRKIRSYEFVEGTNPTLLIRTTSKIPFLRRGAYPVPQDVRERVELLLSQQIGAADDRDC